MMAGATDLQRCAAASRKAASRRKARQAAGRVLPPQLERLAAQAIADGYGPGGPKQGSEAHKVESVADVLARLRARMERMKG